MALTRKFLSALGIEEEKIDEIISAHQSTLSDVKKERDDFREKAENADEIQKQLDKANERLKEYDEGEDSWKTKYESEKTSREKAENDLKAYKLDIEAKEILANKKSAYKKLLKDAGVSDKRIDSILKVSDIESLKLNKDGKLDDADKLIETIKSEWNEFIITKNEEGAETATPPNNNGNNGSAGLSRAAQLAARHHESLYGKGGNE